MRSCSLLVLALCSASLTVAAGEKKKDNLDGTWTPTSIEIEGKPLPAKELEGVTLVIQGDRFALTVQKKTIKGTFKADPSKTPKTIDATYEVDGKKVTVQSIYELSGDVLRVCGAEPGKPRPKEFKTAKGDGQELTVYKRKS